MCPPPAATAGTFPSRGCALFAKPELPPSQLSGPRARERRGGARGGSAGREAAADLGSGLVRLEPCGPRLRASPVLEGPEGLSLSQCRQSCPPARLEDSVGKLVPGRAPRVPGPRNPHLAHPERTSLSAHSADPLRREGSGDSTLGRNVSPLLGLIRQWGAGIRPARGVRVALEGGGALRRGPEAPGNVSKRLALPPDAQRAFSPRAPRVPGLARYFGPLLVGLPAPGVPGLGGGVRGSALWAAPRGVRGWESSSAYLLRGVPTGPPVQRALGWSLSFSRAGGWRVARAASECALVGVWSEPTCIPTHVLAARGVVVASRGHRDARAWREVSYAVGFRSARVCGGGGRVLCFASPEPWPWFCCGRRRVALPCAAPHFLCTQLISSIVPYSLCFAT
ncbi:PREDICTED: uncharacterized protein LOC108515168 [Rhinopithecus bieti]|uniref:uncharacterized protein LOC108515168 n=1 Tax=Rhinopithecus bieti TaxID=61621 RepID=UPI00083C7F8B|nr:PREDICTED: uncharacterized protein LOC108515168 [Rhinopithecus bieti]